MKQRIKNGTSLFVKANIWKLYMKLEANKEFVENLSLHVSSGAQKAIKETGQGRGGQTRRENGTGFVDKANFHTFQRHGCAIWLSSTFHYVVWRCFFVIFNLYVADLQSERQCDCYQHADDTTFYIHSKPCDLDSSANHINKAVTSLRDYSKSCNLTLILPRQTGCLSPP